MWSARRATDESDSTQSAMAPTLISVELATRSQGILAALLALIAGYIDSYSLLTYEVYTSFMSGNTTQAGLNAGQGQLASTGHHLLPIPLFVGGVFIGTFLIQGGPTNLLRRLCCMVAVLLVAGSAAKYFGPAAWWCAVIPLSLAMGIMNTTVTHVGGQSVSLGFVTGDLNNLGRHLAFAARRMPMSDARAPWDTHWWRAILLARVWCLFFLGRTASRCLDALRRRVDFAAASHCIGAADAVCPRQRQDLSAMNTNRWGTSRFHNLTGRIKRQCGRQFFLSSKLCYPPALGWA